MRYVREGLGTVFLHPGCCRCDCGGHDEGMEFEELVGCVGGGAVFINFAIICNDKASRANKSTFRV